MSGFWGTRDCDEQVETGPRPTALALPSLEEVTCQLLSRVPLLVTPWVVALQVPPPLGFSRREYWCVGRHFLQGAFPTRGYSLGFLGCRWILRSLSPTEALTGQKRKPRLRAVKDQLAVTELSWHQACPPPPRPDAEAGDAGGCSAGPGSGGTRRGHSVHPPPSPQVPDARRAGDEVWLCAAGWPAEAA